MFQKEEIIGLSEPIYIGVKYKKNTWNRALKSNRFA